MAQTILTAPIPQEHHTRLSIIVATTQPWPEMQNCLDGLLDQAKACGAELIIADGHGSGLPGTYADSDELIWLTSPGASVFQLRGMACERACGDWIAITEDHCRVAPDWCQSILHAIDHFPDAKAIGGVVENGAGGSTLDWAQFLIANGPFMSPSKTGPAKRIALQANICYRCDALPKIFSEYGLMEMLHNNALQHEKETLIAYDGMRVSHIQSLGLIGSCAINFHNGRSIAGYRLLRISFLERCLRTLTFLLLPPYMLARNVINLLEKRRGLLFVARVLPFMSLLLVCHAFGEFLGYLGGPASSPTRLR